MRGYGTTTRASRPMAQGTDGLTGSSDTQTHVSKGSSLLFSYTLSSPLQPIIASVKAMVNVMHHNFMYFITHEPNLYHIIHF